MRWLALVALSGCATTTNLGLLQRDPGDPVGATIAGSMGLGLVPRDILTLNADVRGDLAAREHAPGLETGSRFAVGASALGGIPIGRYEALARVGFWHSVASAIDDRSIVPTFELAGFIPFNNWDDPKHPEHGAGSSGFVIGVREDLDHTAYTTLFVGLSLFLVPGY